MSISPKLLLGLFLCCCGLVRAQPGSFLTADHAVFFTRGGEAYVEFAYALDPFALSCAPDSAAGMPVWHVLVALQVLQGDTVRYQEAWRLQADSAAYRAGEHMIDMRRVALPPGEYEAHLTAQNLNDPVQETTASFDVTVPDWQQRSPQLSSMQLCAALEEAGSSTSPFVKNQYLIMPQIDGVFGAATPVCYYYFEAYNLAKGWAEPHYILRTRILDGRKNEIIDAPARERRKRWPGPSFIEAGAVDIHALVTGTYFLQCAILDLTGQVLAVAEKKFFVHKPEEAAQPMAIAPGAPASAWAAASEAELDEEFSQVRYLASAEDRLSFAQLHGAAAKREFLSEFWRQRSRAGVSGELMRQAYQHRVREANEKYSAFGRAGWETARGRVYILYGKPSEEHRYPNTNVSRGFERWTYDNIEGGVEFVFVDRSGYGDYSQVHSTKRGELEDPNWQRFLGGDPQVLR